MSNANGLVEDHVQNLQENVPEKIETTQREAKAAIASMRGKGRAVVRRIKSEMDDRPYVGMVACGAVGVAVGALLGSRALRLAAIAGVGYLLTRVPFDRIGDTIRTALNELGDTQGKQRKNSRAK